MMSLDTVQFWEGYRRPVPTPSLTQTVLLTWPFGQNKNSYSLSFQN